MRDGIRNILLSIAMAPFMAGCVASGLEPESSGQGTLILSVGTGTATRADANDGRRFDTDKIASESDKSLDDGDKMKNLRVWLVKDGVVSKFAKLDEGEVDVNGEETLSCSIADCERGDYEIYMVANYTGLDDACPVGKDLNTDNVLMKKYFGPVAPGSCPAYSKAGMLAQVPEDALVRKPLFTDDGRYVTTSDGGGYFTNVGMPLSYKGTVSIGPGENKISVELSRVCARFTMAITNNAKDKYLAINGVYLSAFNQSCGYLFPHTNDSGVNEVPQHDHAAKIAFPYVEAGGFIVIDPGKTVVLRDLYMFETDGTVDKTFTIKAALYEKSSDASMTKGTDYILSNVGVGSHSTPEDGYYYLIRSDLSSTFYLGADKDGSTNLFSFGSDNNVKNSPDIDEYLWQVESSGSNYAFKNLKHKTYLNVGSGGVSASDTKQSITYNRNGYLYNYYYNGYYYITNSSNNPAPVTSGANTWSLRKVEVTENPDAWVLEKPFKSLNYSHAVVHVDKYGVAYNLAQLKRNEHLKLNITVTYSDTEGTCGFELGPWDEVTNETTFD